uniref:Uncharacterized protein n=1 Tax=Agrobacterium tumefaciens TaxID=358 RepID=A0A5B9TAT7_AGRTU|nr:hypothetical protein AgrTiKerr27_00013 [Agrobacterium tumefaciens]
MGTIFLVWGFQGHFRLNKYTAWTQIARLLEGIPQSRRMILIIGGTKVAFSNGNSIVSINIQLD